MKAKPKRQSNRAPQFIAPAHSYTYRPTGARQAVRGRNQPEKPKRNWRGIIRRSLLVLLALIIIAGGWVGWSFIKNEVQIFGWRGLIGLIKPEKLNGEDQGRVNILLAGNSRDDPNHGGANLTDSIMVLSINTRNHSGFMLSIPRDLYVNIPGDDYGKINEVYQQGLRQHTAESSDAGAGMQLLGQVVSHSLGIPIHYYALVDYSALRQATDAVGGIDITINSSDPRGLYDPSPDLANNRQPLVDLPNGPVHLDGVQALGLARARGDHRGSYGYASGDFTRTANQRMIILALKNKGTSLGTLANPLKLGQLFDAMGDNVQTDLTLGNVRRLYNLGKDIPNSKITSAGLTDETLLKSRYIGGAYTLVPTAGLSDYSDIQAYVAQLLAQ